MSKPWANTTILEQRKKVAEEKTKKVYEDFISQPSLNWTFDHMRFKVFPCIEIERHIDDHVEIAEVIALERYDDIFMKRQMTVPADWISSTKEQAEVKLKRYIRSKISESRSERKYLKEQLDKLS
jgi:hypothetical protein